MYSNRPEQVIEIYEPRPLENGNTFSASSSFTGKWMEMKLEWDVVSITASEDKLIVLYEKRSEEASEASKLERKALMDKLVLENQNTTYAHSIAKKQQANKERQQRDEEFKYKRFIDDQDNLKILVDITQDVGHRFFPNNKSSYLNKPLIEQLQALHTESVVPYVHRYMSEQGFVVKSLDVDPGPGTTILVTLPV